jgi:hypothetical protein
METYTSMASILEADPSLVSGSADIPARYERLL